MLSTAPYLLRNYKALERDATRAQGRVNDNWQIFVTEKEYGYIKRRRNQNPRLYRLLLNHLTVLNSRFSLFFATAPVISPAS